jgi:hypothetical protein
VLIVLLAAGDVAVHMVWWISLAAGAAMVAATLALMALLLGAVKRVEGHAARMRVVVGETAEDMSRVAQLSSMNQTLSRLGDAGGGVAMATSRIMMHAATCPSCPACALGGQQDEATTG